MSESLKARTLTGLRWTLLNAFGEKALSFGTTMVLARLLDPHHFGLYALAFVVIDSLGVFKNLGLDAAIIHRHDRVEEAADTAILVLPLIGTALFLLLAAAAPALAGWLGSPEATGPIRWLGVSLIIMSVGNVPGALIQKSMRFGLRTGANLVGMAVYAGVAVALAVQGYGVWSLIAAYLLRWTVAVAFQWIRLGWVPRFRFDGALLKEMLHYGKYVAGAWMVAFLVSNVDRFAIGKWLGTTALGYYTLCLGLATFASGQLSGRIYQVAFPAFAEAQQQREVYRRGVIKLTKFLLLVALPIAALLVAAPAEFLTVVYGERWSVAAPVLQVLAVAGVIETVRIGIDPALMGCGRSRTVFALNLLQLAILGIGSVAMAAAGTLVGVAWAMTAASGVSCLIGLATLLRAMDIRPTAITAELKAIAFSMALMAVSMLSLRWAFSGAMASAGMMLFALVAAGSLAYVVGIAAWDRPVAREIGNLLRAHA